MSLKVSVIGVGKMGKNHLRVLESLKGITIKNIFDIDENELKKLSSNYNIPYTTSIDEALKGIDAAIIVSPTNTHFDLFKRCIGKIQNIFIEKPLAENVAQAEEIKKLTQKNNIFLQCGFIERFNPVVLQLKKITDKSKVINIDFYRTNRLSDRIKDVDVVLDLMIHDIDLSLFINGPINKVSAYGARENNMIAFATAIFEHENGSLSRILASRMTEKKIRSIQVTTEDSFINAELMKKELQVNRQSFISKDNDSYIVSSIEEQIEVNKEEALLSELKTFFSVISGEKNVDYPGINSSLESLKFCESIKEKINND